MTKPSAITVYCGSRKGGNPSFRDAAERLGKAMAIAGIRLVYGGGSVGLMGVIARSVHANGGLVTGIIPEALATRELKYDSADELIVTPNMQERRRQMFERADSFIVLPGGIGTLEEAFEVLSWAYLGIHHKPMVLLNIDNYWQPLVALLEHGAESGFIDRQFLEGTRASSFLLCDTADEALPLIEQAMTYRELDP